MTRVQMLILVCIAFDFIVGIWYSVRRARKAYGKGWDECRRTMREASDRAYAREHNL